MLSLKAKHFIYEQVARLLYTNSGVGLLALASNGVQRLWKWSRNEQNPAGKVSLDIMFVLVLIFVCFVNIFVNKRNDLSLLRLKATASVVPQHWQPNSGLLMTNDLSDKPEDAVPCIALSKNDSYVMSACGGKVSLFNMMTFKVSFILLCIKENNIVYPDALLNAEASICLQVMTTFMSPPPASTFLAFHPQDNNIIAIGMEDSTIHIYNVRVDEVVL